MNRRSKGKAVDLSIHGDEQEHHRIQLEHNLQNTELSFHLSSASDDDNAFGSQRRKKNRLPNDSSVEYPRHLSEPEAMPDFPSFVRRSRTDFVDEEMNSHMHGWSYRTGDDDEGINPYGGESLSTTHHHASVLTLGAGLGGRGARRDPSLSGAEYDPDRPIEAMIAGVNSKHTMLMDSKSHAFTHDPIVVDSTAELDRILQSGHAPPPPMKSRTVRPASPSHSSASTSDSEGVQGQPQNSPRPKLTDHLSHVSFSPKRPRSAQNTIAPGSPLMRNRSRAQDDNQNESMNVPTPRPSRRAQQHIASTPARPELHVHPATPSTGASKFPRIQRSSGDSSVIHRPSAMRPASAPPERNPFYDNTVQYDARHMAGSALRSGRPGQTPRAGKVYLPDVTGLTNAVESPAKPGLDYLRYRGDDRPHESEARLLQTLSAVQRQLQNLQEENSISKRRVRELEMELEDCKRQVAIERTRLIEREELSFAQPQRDTKGKGKARHGLADIGDDRLHERYKEVVEEKKALETLINSLRSHLSRLTSELASHQELLAELRKLREADARSLREKSVEITQLREEVQRLAGEVEVLRGVVEEGLKERRASREIVMDNSQADTAMSLDRDEDDDEGQPDESASEDEDELEDVSEAEPFDPVAINEARTRNNLADRTMRTDIATLGSSQFRQSTGNGFFDKEEIEQIAAEVDERRSNTSLRSQRNRTPSPPRRASVEDAADDSYRALPAIRLRPDIIIPPEASSSRPAAPTPVHANREYGFGPTKESQIQHKDEAPFPQIRGEHLEKLFFAAPEHNAKTCTVCYRRRHRTNSPTWSSPARARRVPNSVDAGSNDEDEGFGEGSDNATDAGPGGRDPKGKEREQVHFSTDPNHWRQAGRERGLPPQTVVTRVIRELEDDFTHYKSVYVELADQYKVMDAISDVPRRNLLANHLREVVDILEQKGDQIAALYDLLSFKDKPLGESNVPGYSRGATTATTS